MDRTSKETEKLPTLEELQESAKDSRYFHFVGLLDPPQPGIRLLFARLEHEHYLPGTPCYNSLKVAIIEWNRKEWVVLSVPWREAGLVQKVASQCGLQVIQGAPLMNRPEGLEQFPISGNGDNVFTLLNPPDHLLFSGRAGEIRAMLYRETFQVLALNQHWDSRN
ncbi:MAG: hypothetical protein A3J76_04600 [Candidatus Moranbacteria bacterium RBG_13_45_13]|nr:MAG: hypothetical protein A3J76_04600 [Candidatus Moranbacteria bacterium RBG_13_45_13]